MNATVDLTRARIVEFDTLYTDGTVSLLVSRRQSSNAFTPLGVNGEPPTEDWGTWSTRDITRTGSNIRILAEFPVTLADLLPEGCTRFEFNDGVLGAAYYARRFREGPHHHRDDLWNVTAIVGDAGGAFKLGDLARRFDIDLDTVIPLTVHPQHVEERR